MPDANVTDALKLLFLVRDKLDWMIGQVSLNDPLIEMMALLNAAIKKLAD